jgi:hypothetical protein
VIPMVLSLCKKRVAASASLGLLALLALLALRCVPDGAPVEPRGAIGITTDPSPATRGEPFTTQDGFKVTIRRLIVFAMFNAVPPNARGSIDGEVAERLFLWNASNPRRAEEKILILRAIPVGDRSLRYNLQGRGKFIIEGAERSFYLNVDVDKATEDRFRQPPEGIEDIALDPESPPMQTGMLLTARLENEKNQTTIDLDMTLLGQGERNTQQIVNVAASALTPATWKIFAERFFAEGGQDIANADTNHDGRVTGQELRAATITNPETGEEDTVLNRLSVHTGEIIVPPP